MSKQQQSVKRVAVVLGLVIAAMVVSIVIAVVLTMRGNKKRSQTVKNTFPSSPRTTNAPTSSGKGSKNVVPTTTSHSPFSTRSSSPSLRPSSSPGPSSSPTTTIRPSSSPAPSSSPSLSMQPSSVPTRAPSAFPTSYPSDSPSDVPSSSPSLAPSPQPSIQPTISPYDFVLKMHWKADYFWQETFQEFHWCVECTRCINLTDTEKGSDLCNDETPNDPTCFENDQIWIQNCGGPKRGNAVFNLDSYPTYDVLRIKSTDLCLARTTDRYVRLERCVADMDSQKWKKITLDAPFDLQGTTVKDYRCLTQAHHPNAGEILHMKNCSVAYAHNTSLWDAIAA